MEWDHDLEQPVGPRSVPPPCDGRGNCLEQQENGYSELCRYPDVNCGFACKPVACPNAIICGETRLPQWLLDCQVEALEEAERIEKELVDRIEKEIVESFSSFTHLQFVCEYECEGYTVVSELDGRE